jgi:3-phenylpropionate/cinnamic acid dioxygenase small subunit
MTSMTLQSAIEFIWLEADLLDAHDYAAWLALWTGTGRYIIPTERDATDYAAVLNVVYDDHAMREARVKRLQSGLSMSASPSARTVRTVSRFREMNESPGVFALRCAQHIVEYKYDRTRMLAADVVFWLVPGPAGLALERKVVTLINADDALHGIGYLL